MEPSVRPLSRLRPRRTLLDVFGAGVAYVPRTSVSQPGWVSGDPRATDIPGAALLPCAGGAPFVCHAATVTPEILAWLDDAGLPIDAEILTYDSPAGYLALLRDLACAGVRLAMQHVHPEAEVPRAACVVDPDLQRFLNDKANLEALVPPDLLAPRRVAAVRDLAPRDVWPADGSPVVVKLATPLPHGGGLRVFLCRTPSDVEAALRALGDDARAVIEAFVPHRRSVCVNAVVLPDGAVEALGAAEQVCDAAGRYRGNRMDDPPDVPPEVTAAVLRIVRRAADRGYRGFAGVDVAFARDGRAVVLDLNFRSNGSTAAILLWDDLRRLRGARALHFRAWSVDGGFDALRRVVDPAIERGVLVPRSGYDPAASDLGGPARMAGFLLGSSRAEVEEEDARLAAAGLL